MTDFEKRILFIFSTSMMGVIVLIILAQVILYLAFGIEPYWMAHKPWWTA